MLTPAFFAAVMVITTSPIDSTEAESLTSLHGDYLSARKAYLQTKDETAKMEFVSSTVEYGTAAMNSNELPPNVKYPQALRLYRQALFYDPGNPVAKENIDLIAGIYQSLGRAVPN